MTVKVAEEWLNACSGCEITVLDMGDRLLQVLEHVQFVHIPALMDHKYYGQLGDKKHLEIPSADVGIISGGIRNEEHLEVAQAMRESCDLIVAIGTCATHGGIPALCNSYKNADILERYYSTQSTDVPEKYPSQGVPELLDRCFALDEKIKVDICMPGCPPHPDQVYSSLISLVQGNMPELPGKSVCDVCPTIRKGKGQVKQLRRFLQSPVYESSEPLDEMRCLLEQGILCMGPVTRAGCGGDKNIPRCVSARVPCRGCYGPVRFDGNPLLDMLNALSSNGIEFEGLGELTSLLRFAGAHNLLQNQGVKSEDV
ncbi:MAG: methyl viologen-reducing hydrogenase [Thermodesulfobacteriota bacterium]